MPKRSRNAGRSTPSGAFTLVELLVSMTVLVLLIGMIAQMINGVSSVVGRGQAHIDTDGQARTLLDRMAIDFGAMVKRPDVDYYLKGRPVDLKQPGNDQIAFYSEVPGYFSSSTASTAQSSASLIAYRVNSSTMYLERLSKGLAWNGASAGTDYTMSFLPVPLASPLPSPLASPLPSPLPTPVCPKAADMEADLDYEQLASQVFRFEYYYVLKGQSGTNSVPMLSLVPWYAQAPVNHNSVNGMQDVAGIGVLIALIDSKSRKLVSADQLATLVGQMEDAPDPATDPTFVSPGDIEKQWMSAVNSSSLPRPAKAAIRVYTRCFYLNGVSP